MVEKHWKRPVLTLADLSALAELLPVALVLTKKRNSAPVQHKGQDRSLALHALPAKQLAQPAFHLVGDHCPAFSQHGGSSVFDGFP
jgi:hypothetical protein